MKKIFFLAAFAMSAVAANAQCSGAKATATTSTTKACCAGKKACSSTASADKAETTTATADIKSAAIPAIMTSENAVEAKPSCQSAQGKKTCSKSCSKTAEAKKEETAKPVSGTN